MGQRSASAGPSWGAVHASDREVEDERIASAVDAALGAGAYARARLVRETRRGVLAAGGRTGSGSVGGVTDGSERSAVALGVDRADVESPFQALFGEGYVGRPRNVEFPVGLPTGDRALTETARRRATRVLKHIYAREFLRLMEMEIEWLMVHRELVDGRGAASSSAAESGEG